MTEKWAKLEKTSHDPALREIQDLIKKRILKQDKAGGRSTAYIMLRSERLGGPSLRGTQCANEKSGHQENEIPGYLHQLGAERINRRQEDVVKNQRRQSECK